MRRWSFWRLWSNKRARQPWSKEVQAFMELAVRSGLVNVDVLNEACADCASDRVRENALDDVCAHLISKGTLTKWQCNKLRQRKWKGFFLDGYRFLGQMSKDTTTSTYLCTETATGKRVAMAVTPPMLSPDGKIRYTVRELPDDANTGET